MIPAELEGFGEDTLDMLWDRVYPVYTQTIIKAEEGWPEDKELRQEKEDAALKDANKDVKTAMQYQHPELERLSNGTGSVVAEKILRHILRHSRKKQPR